MSMTEAQASVEVSELLKKANAIEKKYPDGTIEDNEDRTEYKRLLENVDALEDKLAAIREENKNRARVNRGLAQYSQPVNGHVHPEGGTAERSIKSASELFIESGEFVEMTKSGVFNNPRARVEFTVMMKDISLLAQKALVFSGTGSGGSLVQNDVLAGLRVPLPQRELTLMDLVPTARTSSDTIEYVREDSYTNAAAPVAEATATTGTSGTKPESTLVFSTQTAPVRTIAHWVPITNRMLADAPAIRGIIDNRLLLGLDLTLESQIITGDGTGENLLGILNAPSINIQAGTAATAIDSIFRARTQVRVVGKSRPTGVVVHPNDWEAMRLARENAATGTLGAYLMGPPSQIGATTLWGLPVVESEGIPENTALVGDFAMGCMLFDREQSAIRVGYIDQQFVRNMITLLAELRAAFVTWRGAAFSKVTGI